MQCTVVIVSSIASLVRWWTLRIMSLWMSRDCFFHDEKYGQKKQPRLIHDSILILTVYHHTGETTELRPRLYGIGEGDCISMDVNIRASSFCLCIWLGHLCAASYNGERERDGKVIVTYRAWRVGVGAGDGCSPNDHNCTCTAVVCFTSCVCLCVRLMLSHTHTHTFLRLSDACVVSVMIIMLCFIQWFSIWRSGYVSVRTAS